MNADPVSTEKKSPYGIAVGALESGADKRDRTADLLITNQLLYQLSYVGAPLDCIAA